MGFSEVADGNSCCDQQKMGRASEGARSTWCPKTTLKNSPSNAHSVFLCFVSNKSCQNRSLVSQVAKQGIYLFIRLLCFCFCYFSVSFFFFFSFFLFSKREAFRGGLSSYCCYYWGLWSPEGAPEEERLERSISSVVRAPVSSWPPTEP